MTPSKNTDTTFKQLERVFLGVHDDTMLKTMIEFYQYRSSFKGTVEEVEKKFPKGSVVIAKYIQ